VGFDNIPQSLLPLLFLKKIFSFIIDFDIQYDRIINYAE
jgi:hypothetical protein